MARKNARQTSKKVASKKARFSATAVTARPRRVLLVQLFLRLNLETQKSSNLTVTDRLEAESSHLDDKIRTLANQIEELIAENQRLAQDQEQYLAKYTQLDAKYQKTLAEKHAVEAQIAATNAKATAIKTAYSQLADQPIRHFQPSQWTALIDHALSEPTRSGSSSEPEARLPWLSKRFDCSKSIDSSQKFG